MAGATLVVTAATGRRPPEPPALVRASLSGEPPERPGRRGARLDGLRVLVVDDETDAREVVGLVLRERGAEVQLAGSVLEALDLLRGRSFDVLVSDLAMPGADGYDLIRAVRSGGASRASTIPAVAPCSTWVAAGSRPGGSSSSSVRSRSP